MFMSYPRGLPSPQTELNFLLSPSCETAPKSMFWAPPVCLDLSRRHDWPVKKAVVDLPIRLKGDLKRTSGNSLSPFGAQNKDLGAAASQTLLDVASRGKITSATQATSGVA